jgi:hypothetical protein
MLSCAKQIWRTEIPAGGGPLEGWTNGLAERSLRTLANRLTVHGEPFSHKRVRDQKRESVVKTGMKLEPFCLDPRLRM